jgi:N-ethylmaleimide reductase
MNNVPSNLMAAFYRQRASAGLIITEGTSPSPNGLGYSRIPGIFSRAQIDGWKAVTKAVHDGGGKIFVQLMHTGRIGHPANMPADATILAPSAVRAAGQMWTDDLGVQDFPIPKAMSLQDIDVAKSEFREAAKNALDAEFDGVELHAANGYLLEEFLSPVSNTRTDLYGGNVANRCRFVLDVARGVADIIGRERVGLRISPYGVASDMPPYPEIDETYACLASQLDRLGLLYLHIVDHGSMGAPKVPDSIKVAIRDRFHGAIILSGGYTLLRAMKEIEIGGAELIAFGRPFISNPDLVERFKHNWPLSEDLDMKTFYTTGEKGYTDYPVFATSGMVK